jgi:ABC-type multidrug transport system ATPase subunit
MHALSQLILGRTVLMISHRLNSLGQADEIIVLREGEIAEHGSYRQLKRLGGVFAYMLEEQNRYNADVLEEAEPVPPPVRSLQPAAVAGDGGLAAAHSHSRWIALETPSGNGERDDGAPPAADVFVDLRRARRSVRQD